MTDHLEHHGKTHARSHDGRFKGRGIIRHYERRTRPVPPVDAAVELKRRLVALLFRLSESSGTSLHENIQKLTNALLTDFDKQEAAIPGALMQCIESLPMKSSIYGSLVGVLNVHKPDFGRQILMMCIETTDDALKIGKWREVKLLLRFLIELANSRVVLPEMLLSMLRSFAAVVEEPDVQRDRADCFAYMVLINLPVLDVAIRTQFENELSALFAVFDVYFTTRRPRFEREAVVLGVYKQEKCPYLQEDILVLLYQQTRTLIKEGAEVKQLVRTYGAFQEIFSQATSHPIPEIPNIPPHMPPFSYPLPRYLFRLFPSSATSVSHNCVAFYLIHDVLTDWVDICEVNRKECVRLLLTLEADFAEGTFVSARPPDLSVDELSDNVSGGWSVNEAIAENLFGSLFQLPHPPRRLVYYSVMLMEMIRAAPENFPKIIGRSIFVLFNRLDSMDVECSHRLYTHFAHHLSNFSYNWNWKEWVPVVQMHEHSPQRVAIRSTLDKCIRLAFLQRIRSAIPEELHSELPKVEPGPAFSFTTAGRDPELHDKVATLLSYLKSKRPPEDIYGVLKDLREHIDGGDSNPDDQDSAGSKLARQALIECLLQLGSKSFSHVLNVVERNLAVLQAVCGTHDPEGGSTRLHTIKVVAHFWRNNTQFMGIILDKFLNYRVIDPAAIVDWVFETVADTGDFSSFHYWEILRSMLSKVGNRVAMLRERLETCSIELRKLHAKERQEEDSEFKIGEMEKLKIQTETTLSQAIQEQKTVFISVLQKFIMVIDERLAEAPEGTEELWFYWAEGWFREIGRSYHTVIADFVWTFENVMLTPDLDPRVRSMFADIRALIDARKATVAQQ